MTIKIQKLDPQDVYNKIDVISISAMAGKIDELVDAVNAIQKEREAERFEIQEWIGILEAVRKSVNIHEKQIDELQMKLEPEKCETPAENVQELAKKAEKECRFNPVQADREVYNALTRSENVQPDIESRSENVQDKFAEQRKWIGKLCKFRHGLGVVPTYGILSEILPDSDLPYYKKDTDTYWKYCEPVKPDDDIIYKGGGNE